MKMHDLMIQATIIRILNREAGEERYHKSYFSRLVSKGVIRYHNIPDKKKKYFRLEEVKEDLADNEDPKRDPQRDANARKRREQNDSSHDSLLEMAGKYDSVADLSDEEKAERVRLQNILLKQKEEAMEAGIDDSSSFSDEEKEHLAKLPVKELNLLIMKQDLRIKTATANEKESKSIPFDKVKNDITASMKIIRDGVLGIPVELSSSLASISDPHECRIMIEKEIIRQLTNLGESFSEL
jgi:hypothetical protein